MARRKRNFRSTSILRYKEKQIRLRMAGGVPEDMARATVDAQATEYLLGSARYMDIRKMTRQLLQTYKVSPGFYMPYMAIAEWVLNNVITHAVFSEEFAMDYIKERWPEAVEIQGGAPLKALLLNLGLPEEVIDRKLFEVEERATSKTMAASNIAAAEEEAGRTPKPKEAGA